MRWAQDGCWSSEVKLGTMKPPFTQEEWERTPESVRSFVVSLLRQVKNGDSSAPANERGFEGRGKGSFQKPEVTKQSVNKRNKLVVFISDVPRSREAKLMHGLRNEEWTGVLLYRDNPTFDPAKYFSSFQSYKTPEQALSLARNFSPYVYHVFSNWKYDTAEHFIRNKPGPVVFDDYDVMAGMVQPEVIQKGHPGQLEKERYCLESADGLLCRSIETNYAHKYLGYRFSGSRIFFPEYLWNWPSDWDSDEAEIDALVYVGNLPVPGKTPANPIVEFLQMLSALHLPLHVYPSLPAQQLIDFSHHWEKGMFVVHDRQSPDQLSRQLRRYLAGVQIPLFVKNRVNPVYTEAKGHHSISGKIFDYLEAGIPTLAVDQHFQLRLLRRYSAAVSLNVNQSDDGMMVTRLKKAKQRLRSTELSKLTIDAQISRLLEFYAAVVSGRPTEPTRVLMEEQQS